MAVLLEGSVNRYVGLAGDTKPTGVPVGSTYLAYDTDETYITYDGTTWVLRDLLVRLVAGTAAIGKLAANSGVDIGDVDVLSIAAGANVIGKIGIDQTTPGTTNKVEASTNARRNGGALHRDAITAVDKIAMGALTTSQGAVVGALTNVAHSVAVVANTAHGPTTPQTGSLTPDADPKAIRIAWTAVTGAVSYDIFCSITSVDVGKWVGRVTAAQHATGGQFTAVGTYAAGGTAGAIDIGVVGTGVLHSGNPFLVNNAYTPAVVAAIGSINCAGYKVAKVKVLVSVTDFRSLPTLALIPFFGNQVSASDWHSGARVSVSLLTALGEGLTQELEIDVAGEPEMVILVDTISGQGTAVSIWVELA